MENQQAKDITTAIKGLISLSAESALATPRRFFVDVSVWASKRVVLVEIIDLRSEATVYLDSSKGAGFTRETINGMEDRLIEKWADLNEEKEIAA
ncbi:hypothetical protein [Enterovibrio norvegicus]|uniref:hypothetical protein n=1 Tax=Enterovibrio norvegicus TaxID=188144 RepID=UPI000C83737F|nr:hypothetical protein [Enterovibrio norvegicus]PMN68392.1 hypothetical protein BCT27_23610 [Enterovibrio norvegicus]